MKRAYRVRRSYHPHAETDRLRVRVYQLLLRWTRATPDPSQPPTEEQSDEDRDLRPSFNPAPSSDPDH